MTRAVENVLTARARLGESPLWDAERQRLYWVDIYNHRVHEFDPKTGGDRSFEVGDVVSPIALAGKNRLLMGQRNRLTTLDLQTGEVSLVCTAHDDQPGTRFNDGRCDSQGRFWVGSMSTTPGNSNLYRYDPDGSLTVMETDLTIANGMGWSPDETTFYLTDSAKKSIYAYDFDLERGTISNRRVWVNLTDESFEPDGLAIDRDSCIWSAMWNGWCIIRFDPQGNEIQRISVPVQCPTACAFGGENGSDLFISSASVGQSQAEIEKSFYSGDLFRLRTTSVGLPMHSFRG